MTRAHVVLLLILLPLLCSSPCQCNLFSFVFNFWRPAKQLHIPLNDGLVKDQHWMRFKNVFSRSYRSEAEDKHRRSILERNLRTIFDHNTNASNHSFRMGLNRFADMSPEEFGLRMSTGWRQSNASDFIPRVFFYSPNNDTKRWKRATRRGANIVIDKPRVMPKRIDWRAFGVVTRPKDQGDCGNCWAHASAGAIEGVNAIHTGALIEASVQQLVDCITPPDYISDGCNGGVVVEAMKWTIGNRGLARDSQYPLTLSGDVDECHWKEPAVKISAFARVISEEDMTVALYYGPVVAAVDADTPAMQFYDFGVIDRHCKKNAKHGVLIVGYDEDSWIVKNSWGPEWGEDGFFRIRRGSDLCGIAGNVIMPFY